MDSLSESSKNFLLLIAGLPGREREIEEARQLFEAMSPRSLHRLMVELLYGTGMRVSECCA